MAAGRGHGMPGNPIKVYTNAPLTAMAESPVHKPPTSSSINKSVLRPTAENPLFAVPPAATGAARVGATAPAVPPRNVAGGFDSHSQVPRADPSPRAPQPQSRPVIRSSSSRPPAASSTSSIHTTQGATPFPTFKPAPHGSPARASAASSSSSSSAVSVPRTPGTKAETKQAAVAAPVQISERDQVAAELLTFFGGHVPPAKTTQINPKTVSQNEQGLVSLASNGYWNHVVTLAERLINQPEATFPGRLARLRVHNYQMAGWIKLKQYDKAREAMDGITALSSEERPDTGSADATARHVDETAVPFNMRVMEAMLEFLQGHQEAAIDALLALLASVQRDLARSRAQEQDSHSPEAPKPHVARPRSVSDVFPDSMDAILLPIGVLRQRHKLVSLQLVAVLVAIKNYATAIHFMDTLLNVVAGSDEKEQEDEEEEERLSLLNYLGRIHLQAGSLSTAEHLFGVVARKREQRPMPSVPAEPVLNDYLTAALPVVTPEDVQLNKALCHMASEQYTKARKLLQGLLREQAQAYGKPRSEAKETKAEDRADGKRQRFAASSNATLVNNFAICCLYCNRVVEGISALERLIAVDPIGNTQEILVSNLCTLYELSSVRPAVKRQVLGRIVALYGSDDFDLSSLHL